MTQRPRRRLFLDAPLQADARLTLERAEAHYLSRVLRLPQGSPVTLFNGDGCDYDGVIVDIQRNSAIVEITEVVTGRVGLTPPVEVALPILKGDRMDVALQKATELGAARFLLTECERGDVQLQAQRLQNRLRHWQGVINSACEQCGRATVPEIDPPQPLQQRLAEASQAVCLDASGNAVQDALTPAQWGHTLRLFSGPEGGFSAQELETLAQHARLIRHGELVLRAETAPLVGLTLIAAFRGTQAG